MDVTENTDDDNGTISQIIGAPLEFVRRIIPTYGSQDQTGSPVEEVEMVGDKLRKKRMKSKRRSGTVNIRDYKGSYNTRRKKHGYNRSVVRYIGSNAPIAPSKRACFEYFDHSRKAIFSHASTLISSNLDQMRQHVDHVKLHVVPSLADLGQLVWEDGFDESQSSDVEQNENDYTESSEPIEITTNLSPTLGNSKRSSGEETKITALEDELAKLRAQIAMIVSNQAGSSATLPVAVVQPTTAGQPTTIAPPPPPPVPPPLPFLGKTIINAKSEPAKERTAFVKPENTHQNNMDDLLKGLANVKLKTVDINRSPGGTPIRKKTPREDSTNPADIIAKALREKFKSKMCYDSPEGEDSAQGGFTPSPKGKHQKKSPRVHSRAVRPMPRPRPRPKPRAQKRTKTDENTLEKDSQQGKEKLVFN